MELIERINGLEGEVKLVKTEIKRVLIDLREAMNNLENPFANVEQLRKVKDSGSAEPEPVHETKLEVKEEKEVTEEIKPAEEIAPELEPEVNQVATVSAPVTAKTDKNREKEKEELKKLAKITGEGAEKIDIFTLTQLMKWADSSLSNIGKEKLDKILDLYELTGRIPKETKDLISKIEALSNVNHAKEKEEIEMKDCILAVYQLDRILTGETQAQAPLLLSEEELGKWLKV
jgi:archaellum component FlaD/FlaE